MGHNAVVRRAGEGAAFWMLGGLYEVKLSSEESGGAVTVMQFTIPEGMGPPPHIHDGDETVTVLDGRARFHIGGDTAELGPGAVVYFPAGTQETFEPIGQVRIAVTYTPGGIDKFFAEAGEPAQTRAIPPAPSSPPDFERLAAIAGKHGLRLLPPPGS
jgi:quercetin dioxygenase-like cupin family protein